MKNIHLCLALLAVIMLAGCANNQPQAPAKNPNGSINLNTVINANSQEPQIPALTSPSNNNDKTIDITGGYSYYLTAASLALTPYKNSALNRVCFEPAQMETINKGEMFCFTNTQEAENILGINHIDSSCKKYWGTAKIRIKNLTNKNISYLKSDPCSQAQDCKFNEAELVAVLDAFGKGPECER